VRAWSVFGLVLLLGCAEQAPPAAPMTANVGSVSANPPAPPPPQAELDEPEPPAWLEEEAGVARAKKNRKPLIVVFGAQWSTACMQLQKKTLEDAEVKRELQRFVKVRVDATNDDDERVAALQKKYAVLGLPAVIIIDRSGKEIGRISEYVSPAQMLDTLRRFR
jgi:thiol:disulfide interchange protein